MSNIKDNKVNVLLFDNNNFLNNIIYDIKDIKINILFTFKRIEELVLYYKENFSYVDTVLLNLDNVAFDINFLAKVKELKNINKNINIIVIWDENKEDRNVILEYFKIGIIDFMKKPKNEVEINNFKIDLSKRLIYILKYKNITISTFERVNENIFKNSTEEEVKMFIEKNKDKNIKAIVIGASTGGPNILEYIISNLPLLNIPIFVVQHMPSSFTKSFAERINKKSVLNVIEASHNEIIRSNYVYIAPGGYHMLLKNNRIILDEQMPLIHGVRPAVDILFKSAAEQYKENIIGCLLTGMGSDGAEGIKTIKENGGITIVQDKDTSIIFGMPKMAIQTGCVDLIVPYHYIPKILVNLVNYKPHL